MAYRVLIVDDQKMVRQMFETVLNGTSDYTIAGMANTAAETVRICLEQEIDLVLMDVVMGYGMDGLDAAKQIKQKRPDVKIMIVTSMPETTYIDRAKEIGVDSFWHKEVQEQPLLEIMNRTMAGESVYPTEMPVIIFGNTVSTSLTKRELEVLRELVGGSSNAKIASALGISERSVKQHISDMLAKTGFKSRLQLAVVARGGGLVINDIEI
ncbi:response regulator transcription factor [Ruminococcus flavefaciens]|uniref:Stage 0 sporulation protein A homolog n=1 Tax=Ruminococcus flavefaciens TaxID=1265 RepID=A0A1K1P8Z0_RUMFL|nr:response regulator transcription factor [Ruminococcus flavefaciens]SFW43931.1 two component transcriptional regulator, LuxR family [Ruminococcus flavefaciens]